MKAKFVEQMLLDKFNIVVRAGFHCSSGSHHTIKTLDMGGSIRISLGFTNTEAEINEFMKILNGIIETHKVKKDIIL